MRKVFIKSKGRTVLVTVLACLVAIALGIAGFIYSGVYDMAAVNPHSKLVRPVLLALKHSSVEFHARHLEEPELEDPELIKRGLVVYRQKFVTCHGAPGESRTPIGKGLNPNPPPLEKAAEDWRSAEIAWIVSNGLKMAGMPGFTLGEQPDDLWAMTAFVERMHTMTPNEYRRMVAATQGELADEKVQWLAADQGWEELDSRGDKGRGHDLIREYGCGACHEIPGVAGANGTVGAPLKDWAGRHYLAGELINAPASLVPWLMDPQEIDPGTVMPSLGISEEEAWHIARYLYSLGAERPGRGRGRSE